jgi:hypothetical protein
VAAYTYSASRGGDLDRARELLGDTPLEDADGDTLDEELALRSDEQIVAILAREGFTRGVAWLAAALYAENAQQPVRITSAGDSFDLSNLLKAWDALAAPLRAELATLGEVAAATPVRLARIGPITAGADSARKLR